MRSVKINITGVVQGVGFRPFIANLARLYGVSGYVLNTGAGVEIAAEADDEALRTFIKSIEDKKPPRAHIADIDISEECATGYDTFTIRPSQERAGVVFIPADIAVCRQCAKEMLNPDDRRYKYPFINCTQCGPRYTIIEKLPYDRISTTMREFEMCSECKTEFNNPEDRRYHAQPNACPVCGPHIWMDDLKGGEALRKAARLIDAGEIIALRGIGGYHLICDATNDEAVLKLRDMKSRPTKPLAVMCAKASLLPAGRQLKELIFSPEAPIVIFEWENHPLSPHINPLSDNIGVMSAYSPLHRLLLAETDTEYIVATSGNRQDEPIAASVEEAEESLSGFTKYFLHHNREIKTRIDDSVAVHMAGKLRLLRRGRGYAPFPVKLPFAVPDKTVLAVGAGLKSAIAFTKGEYAFVSQYLGDLDNKGTVDFFNETYSQMKTALNISTPDVVVCDKHKGYYSTEFAESLFLPLVYLQHHHAHMYAVMAEHKLEDGVIAVIMDGTGYGDDGNIWGGEIFTLKGGKIERENHIQYVPQAGGDAAVKYPARMAVSWLMEAGIWDYAFWGAKMALEEQVAQLNEAMIKNKINTLYTSSAGRLFESVGAMVLGINKNEYEGHAAIALEYAAENVQSAYNYDMDGSNILISPVIRQIAEDIKNNTPAGVISGRFHNTVAAIIKDRCAVLSREHGINRVVLSGGVFQNKRLLELTEKLLVKGGLKCYIPITVPSNDGSVSLGQAYFAHLRSK